MQKSCPSRLATGAMVEFHYYLLFLCATQKTTKNAQTVSLTLPLFPSIALTSIPTDQYSNLLTDWSGD
jgi:hypothetical protein